MYRHILIAFCFCCLLMAGCLPSPYYQKEYSIPRNEWAYNYKPAFSFDITDTTATYQPYFIIQHTQAYPYANIWVWVYVKSPGDSMERKLRINIPLAEQSGKWLGRGMGEIYEQRLPISFGDSIQLNRKGTYKVSMEQNMRVNPLPDVLHVGLLVKKAEVTARRSS